MSTATVYFSRFPDSLTAGATPIADERTGTRHFPAPEPDVVSIHQHRLLAGRWLVFEWTWDAALDDWQQVGAPFVVPSLTEAIEYVPPGFDAIPSGGFAQFVFKAVG